MKHLLRYFLLFAVCLSGVDTSTAQELLIKKKHEVKRKETIFGIARENGLTVQDLINANPVMNTPGYELKKGDIINIPYAKGQQPSATTSSKESTAQPTAQKSTPKSTQKPVQQTAAQQAAQQSTNNKKSDMRYRAIKVGVMLPLHVDNGDGKRMLEYYRGVLMACDSLRANGISTDVRAWNVAEQSDISQTLKDPEAADCDLIIGPLYTKQLKTLGDFATKHDIKVLIPFSINSREVYDNGNLFQVFQNGNVLNEAYTFRFYQRFKDCHPVIIDCNDTTSTKGGFTAVLRRKLEQEGIKYSITNLKSDEDVFMNNFSTTQRNVVVLNTSRSAELNVAFAKLSGMLIARPQIQVTMFGYPEWLMYTRNHLDNYYKFDVYVPSTYYMDPLAQRAVRFKQKYRWNFHQDMQNYHQQFAATGFDQAYFMIKGLHLYGDRFTGAAGMVGYTPLQNPLNFERIGNGGLQNRSFYFVHYTRNQRVEVINY